MNQLLGTLDAAYINSIIRDDDERSALERFKQAYLQHKDAGSTAMPKLPTTVHVLTRAYTSVRGTMLGERERNTTNQDHNKTEESTKGARSNY